MFDTLVYPRFDGVIDGVFPSCIYLHFSVHSAFWVCASSMSSITSVFVSFGLDIPKRMVESLSGWSGELVQL